MKKKLTLILIFMVLIFASSCSMDEDSGPNPPDDGKDEVFVDTVRISWSIDGRANLDPKPGDRVQPELTLVYNDGTEESVPQDRLSLEILSGNEHAVIEEQQVIVNQDALSGSWIQVQVSDPYTTEVTNVNNVVINILVKKDPADYIDENGVITDFTQIDSLVNKERALPADYVPADLVKLTVPTVLPNPEINQLRQPASDALNALFEEAKEEGFTLRARSGYRSYSTQDSLYRSSVERNGLEYANKYSAKPGHSEHQTGLTMDITASSVNNQLSDSFGDTSEGMWVAENAHRFGFIIRYPKGKEDITGYNYEPWHLRYVGTSLATEIYQSSLTMEEYFDPNRLQP
ncbi:M15 family metallopeptidase [Alkalibacter rhizosphaerae]|uniref:M15 family metallopeptidase n=1 Tax=Alkalibacter rhizosphaerae TaxID=2815577 RepID=A0A974XE09_9FIRM|nr:M15 family metallopeptidase [Alkalibacter rhizosphaerae]QSX07941.1 M15 family metallopeptidase [Alkalibacter rhizosphaerae]